METISFKTLGLAPQLLSVIDQMGFESPTAIQAETIPVALQGHDIVGLSETGSGKTAAFALPSLMQINLKKKATQVLVLCPTRELCVQVCEDVNRLGSKMTGLQSIPVYGGAPIDRQIRALKKGAHIVVGTPGRIIDHLIRGTLKTDNIEIVVLDEADRMLDMGFREDMEEILGSIPNRQQILFFSATMNRQVKRLIKQFGNDPQEISIKRKTVTVDSIEQCYYEVRNRSKVEVLSRLLDITPPRLAMVFCNTKRVVDECTEALLARGYAADRIHGDISQGNRERVLKRFREGVVELLVATDVAARGLDIDDVDVVFNYDLPQDPEDYVHRIGRTGRAGKSGRAVSFIFGRDVYRLQSIERYIRNPIQRAKIPTQEDVEGKRTDTLLEKLRERLEQGDYQKHEPVIDRLLAQGFTPTDISCSLFALLSDANAREGEELTEDKPKRNRKPRSKPGEQQAQQRTKKKHRKGGDSPRKKKRARRNKEDSTAKSSRKFQSNEQTTKPQKKRTRKQRTKKSETKTGNLKK